MKKIQKGFTLIELMIVVAIIGILAAIALPAYQDYTIRAKMTEVITAMSPGKTAISEYYISNGAMPNTPNQGGLNTAASGKFVASFTYETDSPTRAKWVADINTTLDATAISAATNDRVGMEAVGSSSGVIWECGPDDTLGVNTKYLPGSCRTIMTF